MSWMPSPDSSEDVAFTAYKDAVAANADGAFPEFVKLHRILSSIPSPALAQAASRQLTECMKRDFHEHNRWVYHRDNSQVEPESPAPEPAPEPTREEEPGIGEATEDPSSFESF